MLLDTARVVTFIDVWNLVRGAANHVGKLSTTFGWPEMASVLRFTAQDTLRGRRSPDSFELLDQGTYVYGGRSRRKTGIGSAAWRQTVAAHPGFHVKLDPVKSDSFQCKHCGRRNRLRRESGTDARLISDLLWLAWQDFYDVAIVVSGDTDLIPSIERVQLSGRKVVLALFDGTSKDSRATAHASISLDELLLSRSAYSHTSPIHQLVTGNIEWRRVAPVLFRYGHDKEALSAQIRKELDWIAPFSDPDRDGEASALSEKARKNWERRRKRFLESVDGFEPPT